MNINDITPGTMYDAIRNGILTEKAFQEWLDNRTTTSTPYDPFFPLPVPGKRTKVTFPFSSGVAYIGLRNGGKDFETRFEVDDYVVPERNLATFGLQPFNKENLRETIQRIENLFELCDQDGADPRSSEDLCERVRYA